jgi:hypothetical protein
MADSQVRDLLWKYPAAGGFDDALAEFQRRILLGGQD